MRALAAFGAFDTSVCTSDSAEANAGDD
jgi:hypothetical protein